MGPARVVSLPYRDDRFREPPGRTSLDSRLTGDFTMTK